MWRSTFMATMISALIYNSNKAACHFRRLAQINYFVSHLKMTVFTSYLEIFFNFCQGLPRSTFMAIIVLASTSNVRIFASLRMFSFSPFPNNYIKCTACRVLLLTLLLSLYAIGVDDSTRGWKYEIECLYEIYTQNFYTIFLCL